MEDPNYYVPSKECRDLIEFIKKVDPTALNWNTSSMYGLVDDECRPIVFRRSDFLRKQPTKIEFDTLVSFRSINGLEESNEGAAVNENGTGGKKKTYASKELMKRKQTENYKYEIKRRDMKRDDILKGYAMKKALCSINLEALLKEREEAISKLERNQAYLIREGALSNLDEKLKDECKNHMLLDDMNSRTKTDEKAEIQSDSDNSSDNSSEEIPTKASPVVRYDNDMVRQKYYNWMASKRISQIRALEEDVSKQFGWALQSIARYNLSEQL